MTATMRPTPFSPTASDGEAPATRSRPSPPPVIAPIIFASRFWRRDALLSGDHVMGWSTSIVAPPDGSMRAYMDSLDKLRGRAETVYWPGHGGPVVEPQRYLRALIHHRRQREASILNALAHGPQTIPVSRRQGLRGLEPVADARRRPLDPCASRGSERARKGGRRGLRRGRAALPSRLEIYTFLSGYLYLWKGWRSRFGLSWRLGLLFWKGPPIGVGKAWISLDSLVRIETYQWVARDFPQKFFLGPFLPDGRRATPRNRSLTMWKYANHHA